MKKDTVVDLKKPEVVTEDPLMEVLRKGARVNWLRKFGPPAKVESATPKIVE